MPRRRAHTSAAGVVGSDVERREVDGLIDPALPGAGPFRDRYPLQDQPFGGRREALEVRPCGVIAVELFLQVAGYRPALFVRQELRGSCRFGLFDSGLAVPGHEPESGHLGRALPVQLTPPAARRARGEPELRAVRAASAVRAVDPSETQGLLNGLAIAQARSATGMVAED